MPFKFHASRRHKIPKTRYAVKNWPAYEAALRQRGNIRIWIGGDVEAHWTVPSKRTAKGYPVYTDLAIQTVLTLRLVFHLPLRQTEGLVGSIFDVMGLDLSVPDHSTLSRRGRGLERLRRPSSRKDSLNGSVANSCRLAIAACFAAASEVPTRTRRTVRTEGRYSTSSAPSRS